MPLKYNIFENIMEMGAKVFQTLRKKIQCSFGANAPFAFKFSKVFQTLL